MQFQRKLSLNHKSFPDFCLILCTVQEYICVLYVFVKNPFIYTPPKNYFQSSFFSFPSPPPSYTFPPLPPDVFLGTFLFPIPSRPHSALVVLQNWHKICDSMSIKGGTIAREEFENFLQAFYRKAKLLNDDWQLVEYEQVR